MTANASFTFTPSVEDGVPPGIQLVLPIKLWLPMNHPKSFPRTSTPLYLLPPFRIPTRCQQPPSKRASTPSTTLPPIQSLTINLNEIIAGSREATHVRAEPPSRRKRRSVLVEPDDDLERVSPQHTYPVPPNIAETSFPERFSFPFGQCSNRLFTWSSGFACILVTFQNTIKTEYFPIQSLFHLSPGNILVFS